MPSESIVIVGAGHSGTKTAAALRKHGSTAPITLIGDEACLPYDRPPLSKAVLLGKRASAECAFYPLSWYCDNGIELRLNQSAIDIDRSGRRILLEEGWDVSYGRLVLATGSSTNPLNVPGSELEGVFPLRAPHHADAIARLLLPQQRLVVIGAGVIGLEVAAAAVERGCEVKVFEAAASAMGRSLPAAVSSALIAEHRKRGVEIRFDAKLAAIEGNKAVTAVRLAAGEVVPCDIVVYGVGVRPRTQLAEKAGLRVDDGVRTNRLLQTEDESIFACGDVCSYESLLFERHLRLESWRNAEDQADTVARNLLGQGSAFDEVPWFWSHQYDLALHVAGLPTLGQVIVTRTVGSSRVYLSFDGEGKLKGASGLGAVREIAKPIRDLKAAIATRAVVDPESVGAPAFW